MGGWGLCTCLSNTFKKQAGTCLWCPRQGIGFFPPFFSPRAGTIEYCCEWGFSDSFTQTRVCCLMSLCDAPLKKETRWGEKKKKIRDFFFFCLWLVDPISVMVPPHHSLITSSHLVFFPLTNSHFQPCDYSWKPTAALCVNHLTLTKKQTKNKQTWESDANGAKDLLFT